MTSEGPGRGANSNSLRLYNERTLLQRLRRAGEASKADLARWAKLTNTAVGSIVQSLEDAQLIEPAAAARTASAASPPGSTASIMKAHTASACAWTAPPSRAC